LFPGDNENEINKIREILENLISQTGIPSYNYSLREERAMAMDKELIKELQCIFEQMVLFFLCKELKTDGHFVHDGTVYRIEQDEEVVMAKASQQIEKFRKRGKIFFDQKERDKNFLTDTPQNRE